MKLRVNAPVDQATVLLARFAHLGTELALADTTRNEAIAAANVVADQVTVPIVAEMDEIRAQLQPWWERNSGSLLTGKRKSVELGGCMIGSKAGRSSLQFASGDDAAAVKALQGQRWAKPYVRIGYAPDKTAISTALMGKHAERLKALGFSKPDGTETFILERVVQEGTVAG